MNQPFIVNKMQLFLNNRPEGFDKEKPTLLPFAFNRDETEKKSWSYLAFLAVTALLETYLYWWEPKDLEKVSNDIQDLAKMIANMKLTPPKGVNDESL